MEKIEITESRLLIYKKGYSPKLVSEIIDSHKLRGLKIFVQLPQQELDDLDFLENYSFLKCLDITSTIDYDVSFLKKLDTLRELTLNIIGDNEMDLSSLSSLEVLEVMWRKGLKGIEKCNRLTALQIVEFGEDDLLRIANLKSILKLKIKTADITRLSGIEGMTGLESLLLANCRKLKSIDSIVNLNLRTVEIVGCPKIADFRPLGRVPSLEELEITDCKDVSTISFVRNLGNLRKLKMLGNTNIVDGDILVAKNVSEVIYKKRKHYNHVISNEEYEQHVRENMKAIKKLFS
jgi:Leucine-rich repeat (LRR) protein